MKDKIIENWLDNASERSYQPIFCQYLIKAGYQLIHSTRHNASEHGKDIIAIDPDGIPCAFQLKGNPGARITLDYYRRDLQYQLSALTDQVIQNPAIDQTIPHKSYFVTNGRIEEDVSIAITQKNSKNDQDGISQRNIHIIARDQLLSKLTSLGNSLWPSEIDENRVLLEMIAMRGNELYPLKRFHELLIDMLCLRETDKKPSQKSLQRRVSSVILVSSICLGPFSQKKNYWAIVTAWTQTAIYLISCLSRWGLAKKEIMLSITMIESLIADSLLELLKETAGRKEALLSEGDIITDYIAYPWRYTLLLSIFSVVFLADYKEIRENTELKSSLSTLLINKRIPLKVFGEYSIPGLIFHSRALWIIGMVDDARNLSRAIFKSAVSGLPPVYYTPEEIIEDNLSAIFTSFKPTLKDKGSTKSSWMVRQAYMNMVQLDFFDECAECWNSYSLSVSKEFHPKEVWQYCLIYSKDGKNESYVPGVTGEWDVLRNSLDNQSPQEIPEVLSNNPTLLMLWGLIAPHRFTLAALNASSIA